MTFLIWLVNAVVQLAVFVVLVYVLMSYFVDAYHPLRRTLGRVVEPMLIPIRRFVPLINNIDISPIILILIFEILGRIVVMTIFALFT